MQQDAAKPPHHHYRHRTPPPFPMGLSTQINWKKEECPVVLPLHLSGRESGRGCTHGPCRGTISLHLSQTVSSLMGWNIARKYIYLYHRCVLYYLRLKPSPIPRSTGFLSQITSLPPANTLAWQIMLLSQAVHKKNYCSYTANQLMKVKEKAEVKFASKKFQDEHEKRATWKA